jgi:hypothetical protein
MHTSFQNNQVRQLAGFLQEIGLEVIRCQIAEETFLPGIQIKNGKVLVDEAKLLYPGDLLHEAGHLAVVPSEVRKRLSGELLETGENMQFVEVAAIAWSYAVCVHLQIDPTIVFHPAGYKGKSAALLFGFSLGVYPGANHLQAAGMTVANQQAKELGTRPFPHMLKWLHD